MAAIRADPGAEKAPVPSLLLALNTTPEMCVLHVTGELDLATRDQLEVASTDGHHSSMMIDLAAVTFMDCGGYSSLVSARHAVEAQGRSLVIRGQTGQPARLWQLIADLERVQSELPPS